MSMVFQEFQVSNGEAYLGVDEQNLLQAHGRNHHRVEEITTATTKIWSIFHTAVSTLLGVDKYMLFSNQIIDDSLDSMVLL